MTIGLASYLDANKKAVVELFVARVPETLREGLTRSELVDHLPDVLAEVVAGIQAGRWPPSGISAHSPTGAAHGR